MIKNYLNEIKHTLLKIEIEEHTTPKQKAHIRHIKKMLFSIELEIIKKGELE